MYGLGWSFIMRGELACHIIPTKQIKRYWENVSLHGATMIFFMVMPILIGGTGNLLGPALLGVDEVCYPRLNNLSIVLQPLAFLLILSSTYLKGKWGTGWTIYPPLSTSGAELAPLAVDLIIIGLLVSGTSSTLTSLNFYVTTFTYRCLGQTIASVDLYLYSMTTLSALLLLSLPILTGGLVMVITDLNLNTVFFSPLFGGDPVFYQHLFWFFGHPEVYVLILPAFAIITLAIRKVIRAPLFGNQCIALSIISIGTVGMCVWAHHMYSAGLSLDTRAFFTATTLLIGVPTSAKLFNWLGSTYTARSPELLTWYVLAFNLLFILGGMTGIILGNASVDASLHDTFYVVGHFHTVLAAAVTIALVTSTALYTSTIAGHTKNIYSSQGTTYIVLVLGLIGLFFPLHHMGYSVQPRRNPRFNKRLLTWLKRQVLTLQLYVQAITIIKLL